MKLNNIKLVLFDFDGTLVDSMETFADIAGRVMERVYKMPFDLARRQYIETSGLPFFQQLEHIFPGNANNSAAAKMFEDEKIVGYFDQKVYPDVNNALGYLKSKKIKTAVSSNNFQGLVDEFIAKSQLKLDHVLGFRDEYFCKGKGHFEHLEKVEHITSSEMLFIGDSLKDAERALNCKVRFIGRTGLFSKEDFAKRFPGTNAINSLEELKKYL